MLGYYVLTVMTHGTSGGQIVLVDGTPPAAPQVTTPVPNQGFYTTMPPVIAGTAEPGSTVAVSLGKATTDGEKVEAMVPTDASTGAWSYTSPPLTLGRYTVSVTATDVAGNTSESSSVDFLRGLPVSHYGWGCASVSVLAASGFWLAVIVLLMIRRRRGQGTPFVE